MSTPALPSQQHPLFPEEPHGSSEASGGNPTTIGPPSTGDVAHTPCETEGRTFGPEVDTSKILGMPPLSDQTLTATHSCARLLATFSDELVVARTPRTKLPSTLFVVDPATGLVSSHHDSILALSMEVADRLLDAHDDLMANVASAEDHDSAGPPRPPSRAALINHAQALRSHRAAARHQLVVGGVLEHDSRHGGTLSDRLTVRPHADLDADMDVIGTPGGVLDIRTRQILPPAEAARRFISRSTGVAFRPGARDPHVDLILPPPDEVEPGSRTEFIMRWIGWHMTHPPRRDFLALISEGNSGKSTLSNTLLAGLGDYCHVVRPEALARGRAPGPGSHNDEMLLFGGGRRLVIAPEASHFHHQTLNRATGGDQLATRPIRTAAVEVVVTAGLVIVGNTPEKNQDTGVVLGIGGDDDVSTALRDRARVVRLPRRGEDDGGPPDDKGLSIAAHPTKWTMAFREAALARIVQWAVVMADCEHPPERTTEMVMDQAAQQSAESSGWESDFIPHLLTTDPEKAIKDDGGAGRRVPREADSRGVYQAYILWHEANGGASPPAQRRAVTDALLRHYPGLNSIKREGKVALPDGGRTKTVHFDGYYIRDLDVDGL